MKHSKKLKGAVLTSSGRKGYKEGYLLHLQTNEVKAVKVSRLLMETCDSHALNSTTHFWRKEGQKWRCLQENANKYS